SDQGRFAVLLPWALDQLTHGPKEDLSVFRYPRRVNETQGFSGPNRAEDCDDSAAGVEGGPARIVLSRTLRPDRNDVPLGSITPKNFVEGLDLVLRDDDRPPPDSPATDIGQEPRLADDVRLLPDPFLSLVSVDLSEELSALAGGQTARLVAYEAEGLEIELDRCRARKAAEEDPTLAHDGFEELLVEGVALDRGRVDDAELHVELAVEGEKDFPCKILCVWA